MSRSPIRLLPAALVVAAFSMSAPAQGQSPDDAQPVVVSQVVEREVQVGQAFVGSVMPARETEVGSAVDGRVVEYPIRRGDYVEQGQKLAQLLTGLLEIEKRAAEAEFELRKAELLELQNGARPEELERWRAVVAGRKALADYAKLRLRRIQRLVDSRTATEDELQDAVSKADAAVQLHQEGKADYDMAVKGTRVEQIAQAEARLAMAQEAVNRIDDQLQRHTIKAPFDGYVVQELTQVGAWLNQGGLVAKVIELAEVDVECQVLETYLPYISEGMEARVEIPALPKEVFVGRVYGVVPQADLRSRTFPVKVRLKNKIVDNLPQLRGGMFARVALPVGKQGKALLVPKDALVLGGAGSVFVLDRASRDAKEGTVRAVGVQLGASWEGFVEVVGDLKPGDTVVVRGNERLQSGAKVQVTQEI